ncbi:MAG: hypothetical protein QM520_05485 [Gammaproteobacteria bacterium]|nr:hypothetical protein [Gammaproteobacteria bacterium]
MEWSAVLGAFGIGAIVKTILDTILATKKDRSALQYKEKREAYFGLLDALHKAAITPSDENSKTFALWQTRVSIFGSEEASKAVQGIIDTNDGPRELRQLHFDNLLKAIKKDMTA